LGLVWQQVIVITAATMTILIPTTTTTIVARMGQQLKDCCGCIITETKAKSNPTTITTIPRGIETIGIWERQIPRSSIGKFLAITITTVAMIRATIVVATVVV